MFKEISTRCCILIIYLKPDNHSKDANYLYEFKGVETKTILIAWKQNVALRKSWRRKQVNLMYEIFNIKSITLSLPFECWIKHFPHGVS